MTTTNKIKKTQLEPWVLSYDRLFCVWYIKLSVGIFLFFISHNFFLLYFIMWRSSLYFTIIFCDFVYSIPRYFVFFDSSLWLRCDLRQWVSLSLTEGQSDFSSFLFVCTFRGDGECCRGIRSKFRRLTMQIFLLILWGWLL